MTAISNDDAFLIRLLEDGRDAVMLKIERDAECHYSNAIFQPIYPGQTPEDLWMETWGKDDADLHGRLSGMIHALHMTEDG